MLHLARFPDETGSPGFSGGEATKPCRLASGLKRDDNQCEIEALLPQGASCVPSPRPPNSIQPDLLIRQVRIRDETRACLIICGEAVERASSNTVVAHEVASHKAHPAICICVSICLCSDQRIQKRRNESSARQASGEDTKHRGICSNIWPTVPARVCRLCAAVWPMQTELETRRSIAKHAAGGVIILYTR